MLARVDQEGSDEFVLFGRVLLMNNIDEFSRLTVDEN